MFLVPDILFFQEEDIISEHYFYQTGFLFFFLQIGNFYFTIRSFYFSIPYILKIGLLFKKNMYSLPPLI